MPSSKSLLLVLLLAVAYSKAIYGLPVDTADDIEELSYNLEDTENVAANVIEEGSGAKENYHEGHEDEDVDVDIESSSEEGTLKDTTSYKDLSSQDKGFSNGVLVNSGNGFSISSYSDGDSTSTVTIDGRNVHAEISGMTSTSSTIMGNQVFIGDENKMIWTEKSDEMVVIEGGVCTKKTYKNRAEVSSEAMSATDCEQVQNKIKQVKKEGEEMGEKIAQEVEETMANTFYPGFPFEPLPVPESWNDNAAQNYYNGHGLNYLGSNYGGVGNRFGSTRPSGSIFGPQRPFGNTASPFGSSFPFGNANSPFGSSFPFGPNNSPFGPTFPFGPIGSPFASNINRRYGNSGRPGNSFSSPFANSGNPGIYNNPATSNMVTDQYGNTAGVHTANGFGSIINGNYNPHTDTVTDDNGNIVNNGVNNNIAAYTSAQ